MSQTYGNLAGPIFEQIAIRRVRVTSISPLPAHGTQRVLNATGTATLAVSLAHAVGNVRVHQQRIFAPRDTMVERPVRVRALIARRSGSATWTVARVVDVSIAAKRNDLARDPVLTRAARSSLRTVFTFSGNAAAYARAGRRIYATTSGAGDWKPPDPGGPGGALIGPHCPSKFSTTVMFDGDDAFFPTRMHPVRVRLIRIRALGGLPLTAKIVARVTVAPSDWVGLRSLGPAPAACMPATSTLTLSTVMVRSLVSGRWLVAQIDESANGGQGSIYGGLYAW